MTEIVSVQTANTLIEALRSPPHRMDAIPIATRWLIEAEAGLLSLPPGSADKLRSALDTKNESH